MTVSIGAGLSTHPDARVGAIEAARQAAAPLDGARADVAVVFASGGHLAAPEATLEGLGEALDPRDLVGCGAAGVLADGREVEDGTAVAVWAASLGGGEAVAFSLDEPGEVPDGLDEAAAVVLFPDPYSFPAEPTLRALAEQRPGLPVLGGVASARTHEGSAALFRASGVVDAGAVGLVLSGIEVVPVVSQGAAPIGPELTVTAGEGNVIAELAGRPALETLRDVVGELDDREQALLAGGLLLGIVVESGQPSYDRGDFLVRGVIGADPDAGAIAVGAGVTPGAVVRLHARDAGSADEDLRESLQLVSTALGDAAPAGALAFTCNGRGQAMFGTPDHDARAVADAFGGAPAAGFFAAGEIGPVGGAAFLHGFTATLAVFPR